MENSNIKSADNKIIMEEKSDVNGHSNMKSPTKKHIEKGQVLLSSVPFAYVLKNSLRGLHCDNCLRRRPNPQRCSGCASAYYCHRDCQKASWSVHKKECSKIKKLKPNFPPDTARLLARVILRLQDGGDTVEEMVDDVRVRKFSDLIDHATEIKEDPVRQEHFTSILVVLKQYLGEDVLPPASELLSIFGKVIVNCFTITDRDLNGVGLGVYLGASVLDHSCKPNAYASFIGPKVDVRSLYDQPDSDLNKIRISYVDVLNTKEQRQKDLKEGYFFDCDCGLCEDLKKSEVTSSVICGNNCNCPVPVQEDADPTAPLGECPQCGFREYPAEARTKYLDALSVTRLRLEEARNKNYLETCKSLLELQEPLFHRLNLWKVKVLDAAFEASIAEKTWENAVNYGSENLHAIRYYYGMNHPMYGLYLLKIAKIELYLFRFQDASIHIEKAAPIIAVSHGVSHPLYSEDLAPLLKQARQEVKMMQNSGFSVAKQGHPGSFRSMT